MDQALALRLDAVYLAAEPVDLALLTRGKPLTWWFLDCSRQTTLPSHSRGHWFDPIRAHASPTLREAKSAPLSSPSIRAAARTQSTRDSVDSSAGRARNGDVEIALGVLIGVVTTVILESARLLWRPYRTRRRDYQNIQKLELGMQVSYLRSLIGNPFTSYPTTVAAFPWGEDDQIAVSFQSFRLGTHVITVLVDDQGSVQAYALASCDPSFRPKITTPLGDIQLNKTTMAEVTEPTSIHYSVGGTGGFGYFVMDHVDGQFNAYRYTDATWGQFYWCPSGPDLTEFVNSNWKRLEDGYSSWLDQFREEWVVNAVFLNRGVRIDADYSFVLETEQEAYR